MYMVTRENEAHLSEVSWEMRELEAEHVSADPNGMASKVGRLSLDVQYPPHSGSTLNIILARSQHVPSHASSHEDHAEPDDISL